jgi:hypothetical protein
LSFRSRSSRHGQIQRLAENEAEDAVRQTIYAIANYTPVIDGNGGSLTLTPLLDGSGWY